MSKNEIIGVVGAAGDLGSKLRGTLRIAELGAFCYDIADPNYRNADFETWVSSLGQIVEKCTLSTGARLAVPLRHSRGSMTAKC